MTASAGSFGLWRTGFVVLAIAGFAIAGCGAAHAEGAKPQAISPPDTWVLVHAGTIRVMNKLDSTVQDLTLKVGDSAVVQSLKISLLGCAVRPDDLPQDAAAHLTIVDSRPGNDPFDGWILKNEPAINMLEHPVYDVQLAGCS